MKSKALKRIERMLEQRDVKDAALALSIYDEWIADRGKDVYTWDSAFHLLEVFERRVNRWLDTIPDGSGNCAEPFF